MNAVVLSQVGRGDLPGQVLQSKPDRLAEPPHLLRKIENGLHKTLDTRFGARLGLDELPQAGPGARLGLREPGECIFQPIDPRL